MSDTTDLIVVFLAWMLLDLISLITFKKPVKEPRNWKNRIQLKSIITKKHSLISLVIEITGIIFVIYSFSIPWYYHLFRYIGGGGNHFQKLYFIEAINLQDIFLVLLYYSYLIGLVILFVKISIKKKIKNLVLFELGETIFIFPGIMLIFSVQFGGPTAYLAIFVYIQSGYSSGFILYIIGITVLLINGLQFSAYSRFFQS